MPGCSVATLLPLYVSVNAPEELTEPLSVPLTVTPAVDPFVAGAAVAVVLVVEVPVEADPLPEARVVKVRRVTEG